MAARNRGIDDEAGEIGELARPPTSGSMTSASGVSAAPASAADEEQQVPAEQERFLEVVLQPRRAASAAARPDGLAGSTGRNGRGRPRRYVSRPARVDALERVHDVADLEHAAR